MCEETMNKYPKEVTMKKLTSAEKLFLETFKEENKIKNVHIVKNAVVFDIVKPCEELNERITKEYPSVDFIRILKEREVEE